MIAKNQTKTWEQELVERKLGEQMKTYELSMLLDEPYMITTQCNFEIASRG